MIQEQTPAGSSIPTANNIFRGKSLIYIPSPPLSRCFSSRTPLPKQHERCKQPTKEAVQVLQHSCSDKASLLTSLQVGKCWTEYNMMPSKAPGLGSMNGVMQADREEELLLQPLMARRRRQEPQ
jgi:hypothetical protein